MQRCTNLVRVFILVSALMSSAKGWANGLDVLSESGPESAAARSPEKNIFYDFLKKKNYEAALFQFVSAFRNEDEMTLPSNQALYGYLLFKNGLVLSGLNTLFGIFDPTKISSDVRALWIGERLENSPDWRFVSASWKKEWTQLFGVKAEALVRLNPLSPEPTLVDLQGLASEKGLGTDLISAIHWQIAVRAAINGDTSHAAKSLKIVSSAPGSFVDRNLVQLTTARLLFQHGLLNESSQAYGSIENTSGYWPAAQEERAWVAVRLGQPKDAQKFLKPLVTSKNRSEYGPEVFHLQALADYKLCNYESVTEDLKSFATLYRARSTQLNAIVSEADKVIKIEELQNLKKFTGPLPYLAHLDPLLGYFLEARHRADQEQQVAAGLFARSISGASDQVGFQGRFELLKTEAQKQKQTFTSAVLNRVKALSLEELGEIKTIATKLHTLEAEVVQNLAKDGRLPAERTPTSKTLLNDIFAFEDLGALAPSKKSACLTTTVTR